MPTIAEALAVAIQKISAVTDVPQLEAEVLLAQVLNVARTHLHAWPEKILDESQQKKFFDLVARREQGEPIAYLLGHKEFWSLDLLVTPDTLIPRPETELLIEKILALNLNDNSVIADLGTGSGAIALALAHEKPNWKIHATDVSAKALEIAKHNAERLKISNIFFHQGSWCDALPSEIKFDVIVSNPPYIAENDAHLTQGDLRFEPRSALVSAENGLKDISQIVFAAKNHLKSGGFLFIEHGSDQAKKVASILEKAGYTCIGSHRDLSQIDRVTFASWVLF